MKLKKYKNFFYPVLFLALIAMTIAAIISQNSTFTVEGFADYVANAHIRYMIPAVACILVYILSEGIALLLICDALGYRRPFHRGVVYSSADLYFSAITPSATGGQPASALFMMGDGMPSMVTTAALLVNLAMYTLSILAITPLFGLWRPEVFLVFSTPFQVLIVFGAVVQLSLFVGLILLIFREHLLMRIVHLVYALLHKLHLSKRSESARKAKLEALKQDYNACSRVLWQHKGKLAAAFLMNFVQRLSNLLVPAFVYMASGGSAAKVPEVLATQSMVTIGSNAIPIPGAVGISDAMFFDGFSAITEECTNLELLSRSISFYVTVLFCAVITLIAFVVQKKNGRKTQ